MGGGREWKFDVAVRWFSGERWGRFEFRRRRYPAFN